MKCSPVKYSLFLVVILLYIDKTITNTQNKMIKLIPSQKGINEINTMESINNKNKDDPNENNEEEVNTKSIKPKNNNLRHNNHEKYTENDRTEEITRLLKVNNHPLPNKENIYFSFFVFVPLVILIFIATVLSVAAFLILIINSAANLTPITENDYDFMESIARTNYLASIRLRKEKRKKKKMQKLDTKYKKEPENEGAVIKNF